MQGISKKIAEPEKSICITFFKQRIQFRFINILFFYRNIKTTLSLYNPKLQIGHNHNHFFNIKIMILIHLAVQNLNLSSFMLFLLFLNLEFGIIIIFSNTTLTCIVFPCY